MPSTALRHVAKIDGQHYAAIPNKNLKNKDGSRKIKFDHLVDFTKEQNGSYRILQMCYRLAQWAVRILKQMGSTLVAFAESVSSKFLMGWTMLIVVRLPEVTRSALKAISDWSKPAKGPSTNQEVQATKKAHDILDCVASYLYAASMFFINPIIKNVADLIDIGAQVADLGVAGHDWATAKSHVEHVKKYHPEKGPLLNRFVEKMRHSLWKIVKATASILSALAGLLAIVYGKTLLSAGILLGISTLSTVAAIVAHFYEKTRDSELVEYHQFKHPEHKINGMAVA